MSDLPVSESISNLETLQGTPPSSADLQSAQEHYERGVTAQTQGNLKAAIECWNNAVAAVPQHIASHYNLAIAYTLTQKIGLAEEAYKILLRLDPSHKNGLFNYANLKQRQGLIEDAIVLYETLLVQHPGFTSGWVNLGKLYADCNKLDVAESILRKAIQTDPDHVQAHWNLSHVLLRQENWAEAWREYEWRLKLPSWISAPVQAPLWQGQQHTKNILLWNDQGLGDAIQFLRYVRILKDKGHHISVLVQEGLIELAKSAPGVDIVFGPNDILPHFDAHAPLQSLPHLLSRPNPLDSWTHAYLKPVRFFDLPTRQHPFAVGLVWAGNPNHKNDALRSTSLSNLQTLLQMTNIDWYSLQIGKASEQIKSLQLQDRVHDLSSSIKSLSDTAAILEKLDLLITIDSSVAHLAGAMNKETWLMLPHLSDWRWSGDHTTSKWYPSLRIFRQKQSDGWQDLSEYIAMKLKERISHL